MNKKDKMVASQPIKRINGGSAADKKASSREALLSPERLLSGRLRPFIAAQRHLSLRSSYFIGRLRPFIRRRSRFIARSAFISTTKQFNN